MNVAILVGRITKDPELRALPGDKFVCNFPIAVKRKFQKDKSDFFECVAWNKSAETIATYKRKGDEIALSGRFENEDYTDKEGNKRRITKFIIEDNQFVGGSASGKSLEATPFSNAPIDAEPVVDGDLPW